MNFGWVNEHGKKSNASEQIGLIISDLKAVKLALTSPVCMTQNPRQEPLGNAESKKYRQDDADITPFSHRGLEMSLIDDLLRESDKLFDEGRELLDDGDYDGAKEKFRESLKILDALNCFVGLPLEIQNGLSLIN